MRLIAIVPDESDAGNVFLAARGFEVVSGALQAADVLRNTLPGSAVPGTR